MITTLDTQPQEWMEGNESIFHTVAACHFQSIEHIEHWVNKLIPRNQNGSFVKWAGGRRIVQTRNQFIDNCLKHSSEIDFKVNCVSTSEGKMSWFAWAFYMKNRHLVTQRLDNKERNCLVFHVGNESKVAFPVLRAGYLIWYHNIMRYLADSQNVRGKLLSDNFACDGKEDALGVSFVNFLLEQSRSELRISLPKTDRYRECDRLSDYFCGWVNSIRSKKNTDEFEQKLLKIEAHPNKWIENVIFEMNLNIIDKNGDDVTDFVRNAVVSGSASD